MITNIVVHPKGATHIQDLGTIYFLKQVEGKWFFKPDQPFYLLDGGNWVEDLTLDSGSGLAFVKPIR